MEGRRGECEGGAAVGWSEGEEESGKVKESESHITSCGFLHRLQVSLSIAMSVGSANTSGSACHVISGWMLRDV